VSRCCGARKLREILREPKTKEDMSCAKPSWYEQTVPAAEESAPAPVHVTQRATQQWSSLAGSGPWVLGTPSPMVGLRALTSERSERVQ